MKLVAAAILSAATISILASLASPGARAQSSEITHALSLGDAVKYPPDFRHLDYVNPDAPKGGTVRFAAIGSFDSLNPFIVRGEAASMPGFYELLTGSADDDIMSEYGLIAETMEVATDNSWIVFNLRAEARWHDGKPITAEDVVFSFNILKEKGRPQFRYYYGNVEKAEVLGPLKVRFTFNTSDNRELPVIMGQLPVLPRHYWEGRNFDEPSLEIPVGSGPYKVKSFEAGRSITLERDPGYWGKDLPINIGNDNYDIVRIDYYRDPNVSREAFKAGAYDFRVESSAKEWATGYESPALRDGRFKMELIETDNPQGMQGFSMNLRRPLFQDARVREAMILAFDFEWSNKTLFFDQYTRTRSFFQNSPMEAKGLPSPAELALLEPWRGQIPEEVFTTEYQPPVSDGSGTNRDNLSRAAQLLEAAGWKLEGARRIKDGQAFEFEFLIDAGNSQFERIVQPYLRNLDRLGIKGSLRAVDSSQYEKRVSEDFDFDMISSLYPQSLSPGNEQRYYWSSEAADAPGSQNYIGIRNPAIDALIETLIMAPTREELITASRALDRVLQWSHFVVPNWHMRGVRIAYWDKFGRPEKLPQPTYGIGNSAWWIDPAKEAALKAKLAEAPAATAAPAEPVAAEPTAEPATEPAAEPAEAPAGRGASPITYVLYGAGALLLLLIVLGAVRRKKQ
ncbi:microcin C transport system substrate-binding protein [Dongia mobilis]|uniref:Microcin C transport system substrate-binding protein n=1 Tax=Dongia mobilis TaxID=578943 RepID=A0A4R6X2I7_9PROT|nr:extracellular solute-binding protein [Dongia mobilis]TDQ85494.1 microcin C transport system substrate-binding protein [Dongia mobilis]